MHGAWIPVFAGMTVSRTALPYPGDFAGQTKVRHDKPGDEHEVILFPNKKTPKNHCLTKGCNFIVCHTMHFER